MTIHVNLQQVLTKGRDYQVRTKGRDYQVRTKGRDYVPPTAYEFPRATYHLQATATHRRSCADPRWRGATTTRSSSCTRPARSPAVRRECWR